MSAGGARSFSSFVVSALVALLALGFALRTRGVTTAFLEGDELHSLPSLDYRYPRVLRTFDWEGSGLALPLLQKLSRDMLGPSLLSLRLPALLPSLLTLVLVPLLAWRSLGPGPALVGTALLAANGFHAFYSSFARSYGLVGLLALLCVWLADRLVEEDPPRPATVIGLALAAGFLTWAHLTSTPFVAAVFGALLGARWSRAGISRMLPVVAAGGGAAILAVALYAPALARVLAVTRLKSSERYEGSFDAIDVAGLLALGGRPSGWALVVLLVAASSLVVRSEGLRRLPLVLGALTPIPLVFLVRPYGDAYAYARYAVPALPAMVLLIAVSTRIVCGHGRSGGRAWAIASLGLAGGLAVAGPLRAPDDGPFAKSYLALEPLPAFDVPYPGRPGAYAAIEPSASIIEVPALINRSRLLYRNYYLTQPRTTLMGFLPEEELPPGPHVAVRPHLLAGRADYLFVHRDVEREADLYWKFVYGQAWPKTGGSRALMERQAAFGRPLPRSEATLVERLERRFGAPVFADDDVRVYRLR